jgi:uncharacterized protein YndB with AHSA1/START domain
MSATTELATIVQEITIKARARRVYDALTDPQQRMAWWGSPGRFETKRVESDLRAGGRWQMSGIGLANKTFLIKGEYRVVNPPHVLAFTWLPDWHPNPVESLVRFDLTEKDGVTTVKLTHSGLTPESAKAHQGWPQILGWLRDYAEANA